MTRNSTDIPWGCTTRPITPSSARHKVTSLTPSSLAANAGLLLEDILLCGCGRVGVVKGPAEVGTLLETETSIALQVQRDVPVERIKRGRDCCSTILEVLSMEEEERLDFGRQMYHHEPERHTKGHRPKRSPQ